MSSLSQAQKNQLNNFLRSLNQRITNFVEEMILEDGQGGAKKSSDGRENEKTSFEKQKAQERALELDELLEELKNEERAEKADEKTDGQREKMEDDESQRTERMGGKFGLDQANDLLSKTLAKSGNS